MGKRWTTKDIAGHLGVSESSVLRWLRQGDLPAPLGKNGRRYEWDAAEIKKWAKKWFPHLREHPDLDLAAEWWDIADVASYLNVEPVAVQRYSSEGRMPKPERVVGRSPAWRPKTVIEWAQTRPRFRWKDFASKHQNDEGAADPGTAKKAARPKRRKAKAVTAGAARAVEQGEEDPLWGYTEIAAHMGITVEVVRSYKKELGEPERYIGRSPVWRRSAVLAWIASRPAAGWNGERPGRRRRQSELQGEVESAVGS